MVTATADERSATPGRRSLAGRLLVATDTLRDPRFARTVIYMVRHTEGGALGLVINMPIGDAPFERALEPLGLDGAARQRDSPRLLRRAGRDHSAASSCTPGLERRGYCRDRRALRGQRGPQGAAGDGPGRRPATGAVLPGLRGWAPGQLDAELGSGAWGIAPADERLVFDEDPKVKWIEATTRLAPRPLRGRTLMKTIDIHAHLVPRSLWQAAEARRSGTAFVTSPATASAP